MPVYPAALPDAVSRVTPFLANRLAYEAGAKALPLWVCVMTLHKLSFRAERGISL